LLTGQERQTTIMMTSNGQSRLDIRAANSFLQRWPPRIADSVRNMRQIRNGTGVCFDIYSDHYDRFMDNYDHLADRESNLEFLVEKCTELPDCIEEGEFSANWRDNNDDGYGGGFGGMRRQQSYQSNYGNYRGGGGRGRGGYERRDDGYGNSRGRGGNNWDRQGSSYHDRDFEPQFQKSNSYSGGGYGRGTRGGYQGGNNSNYGDRDRSGYSNNY